MKRLVFILITCSLFGANAEDFKTLNTTSKKIDSSIGKDCSSSEDVCRPDKNNHGVVWSDRNELYKSKIGSQIDIEKESNKNMQIKTQGKQ